MLGGPVWGRHTLTGGVSGAPDQAQAQVRQRLEALEHEMNAQQGSVRGGTKSEVLYA